MTKEKKHLKVDPEIHKKLKLRATEKDKTITAEVEEILLRELEGDNGE